jgi:hypothetical protein
VADHPVAHRFVVVGQIELGDGVAGTVVEAELPVSLALPRNCGQLSGGATPSGGVDTRTDCAPSVDEARTRVRRRMRTIGFRRTDLAEPTSQNRPRRTELAEPSSQNRA